MRRPPLQPPLLWQLYLLFWVCGLYAALWPVPGLCCAALLLLADARLRYCAGLVPVRAILALSLCAAGLGVGLWQLGPVLRPAAEPAWLAASYRNAGTKTAAPRLRICGLVRRVQGMPDGRLRILLADVRPEIPTDAAARDALPGLCAWTWEEPAFRPLAGQRLCVTRRPMPMRGFANSEVPDYEASWAAQGVFWRVWSRGNAGSPASEGAGFSAARLREYLRQTFLRILTPAGTDRAPDVSGTSGASAPTPPSGTATAPLAQNKAILLALLFGDRSGLSRQTLDNVAAASLAHSLALSGQHLAVAGLIGLLAILLAARLRPSLYLTRARAVWVSLASLTPALGYLWLGDAPPSLIRAACMLAFIVFRLLAGRPATTLDALCAAVGCIVVLSPLSVFDLGLQLSALCVAVIGLLLPGMRRLWPGAAAPIPLRDARSGLAAHIPPAVRNGVCAVGRLMAQILLVSFCIQAALLPLMLLRFGTAGVWFPLNVLWLPAVDLLTLPGAVLSLALGVSGLDAPAAMVADLAALPCSALLAFLELLRAHGLLDEPALLRPHWTALAAFAALAVAVALAAGGSRHAACQTARPWLAAGLLLLCIGPALRLAERLSPTVRLDILDVGQGQAMLLRLPGHGRLLLDGGGTASPRFDTGKAIVEPAVTDNDAPRLAAVISSHPHLDHLRGLFRILERHAVGALFHNGQEADAQLEARWRCLRAPLPGGRLTAGQILELGSGLRLEVLHPPDKGTQDGSGGWSGNNASLVLRLTRKGQGLLLMTGDAERPTLQRLLDSGADLSAQALVVPHHGSDSGYLPEFYAAVRPRLALVSCGYRNRYRYPGKRVASWFRRHAIPLLETGENGRIRVEFPEGETPQALTARRGVAD